MRLCRVKELFAAMVFQIVDPAVDIKGLLFQQCLDILRRKQIFRNRSDPRLSHRNQRDGLRILRADVGSDRLCIDQTARNDLRSIGTRSIDDPLGTGAGGMDHRLSPEVIVGCIPG